MRYSRLILFLLPAFVLGMVPACKKDSGKIKVAIVTNNPESFWTICEAGARKAAKDFDVELIFRKPDKGEVGIQMQIVKSLTEQGISGIAVSVIDPKEQAPDLRQIASKTKLVTMVNDADGSNRICYIGTDNYAAGRQVGRLVRETMPGGGEIAIFVGQITPINARQRFQGVVDELAGTGQTNVEGVPIKVMRNGKELYFKKYGDYLLYSGEAITDNANKEEALKNAKGALDFLPDSNKVCMIGLWAYNPPKILEAIASKQYKNVQVVGFDEDELTLNAIDQGRMYATVVQDPFNFGYKSVEVLAAEARGDKSKSGLPPIPYRVVTRNGGATKVVDGVEVVNRKASEFRDELKALLDSVK